MEHRHLGTRGEQRHCRGAPVNIQHVFGAAGGGRELSIVWPAGNAGGLCEVGPGPPDQGEGFNPSNPRPYNWQPGLAHSRRRGYLEGSVGIDCEAANSVGYGSDTGSSIGAYRLHACLPSSSLFL